MDPMGTVLLRCADRCPVIPNFSFSDQLLQSDLLIPQIEVTFSALKRSLVGRNEVTLKNLGDWMSKVVDVYRKI